MSDKDLLEKAAKAYFAEEVADGVCDFRWDEKENAIVYIHAYNQDHNGNDVELLWIPLDDDGDALRLAVKLRMRVATPTSDTDCAIAGKGDVRGVHVKAYSEDAITDNCEATRRAIVRAAAEIGAKKSQPNHSEEHLDMAKMSSDEALLRQAADALMGADNIDVDMAKAIDALLARLGEI